MDFRKILTKQHQRDLKLLDYFYTNDFAVDEVLLQQRFSLSNNLLQKNFSRLSECCPGLNFSRSNGHYLMSRLDAIGYDGLCLTYLSKTSEVKLLRHLFLEDCQTQTDCADAVFISVSHANRILLKIQKMFSEYGVTLMNKPMRLAGNECFLRHFYTRFFSETGGLKTEHCFVSPQVLSEMDSLLTDFLHHHKIPENHYRHSKLLLSMAIGWQRNHCGQQLFNGSWQHPYFDDPALFLKKNPERASMTAFQQLTSQSADLLWLCYSNCCLLSHEHYQKVTETDQELSVLKKQITGFLSQTVSQRKLAYTDTHLEKITYGFLQENTAFRPQSDLVRIFRHPTDSFLSRAAAFYPHGTNQIRRELEKFLNKEKLAVSPQLKEYLLFYLMKEIPEIICGTLPLKILVMSDLTDGHDRHMAVRLQELMGRNLSFETIPAAYFTDEKLNVFLGDFDLIIATFSPEATLMHHPFWLMDPFLNYHDLDLLHQKLQQMRQEKVLWQLEDPSISDFPAPL